MHDDVETQLGVLLVQQVLKLLGPEGLPAEGIERLELDLVAEGLRGGEAAAVLLEGVLYHALDRL